MTINIDISAANRKKVAQILNEILAEEFVLYVRTLNYHWNITSHHFPEYHKFLQTQYEELFEFCDTVAERVRAMDEKALGSMAEFIKHSELKEKNGSLNYLQMFEHLLEGHEAVIRTIRVAQQEIMEKFKDAGSNNMLLNMLEKQEKMAWMIRSITQAPCACSKKK